MKKKILFCNPCLRGGGAEKVLVNLLNNIDLTRFDVTLFTIFKEGVNRERLKSNIKHIYLFKNVFRGSVFIQKLFTPKLLFKLLIREDYDLIVAYQEGMVTRLVSGCQNPKTKKIAWIHIELKNINEFLKVYRSREELKNTYKTYDLIVGVSNIIVQSFVKTDLLKNKPLSVLYNTNLTDEILSLSKEAIDIKFDKSKINLITVGRLVPQKGYDRLLRCIWRLRENLRDNFHLYILGSGEGEKELLDYVNSNNLENCISFLGFKNNPYKYLKEADLFVCSSYNEGFSTSVSESVIIGTPVLTTDCSGMNELFGDNEYGYIVENNEDALFNGLKLFLDNKELIYHYRNKTKLRASFFSTKETVHQVEDTFNCLLLNDYIE